MANTTGIKHGGRKKGTPNRMTKELRSVLKDVMHQEIEIIQDHLVQLSSKERVELLIKLMLMSYLKLKTYLIQPMSL